MTMKTSQPIITIRDLINGYQDNGEKGVVAYGGKLNVRPAYQRAFVYNPDDRDRVMLSVYNNMPLNSMYWAKNPDDTYEVIDGQQRLISICQFITNDDGFGNPIAIDFNGKNIIESKITVELLENLFKTLMDDNYILTYCDEAYNPYISPSIYVY